MPFFGCSFANNRKILYKTEFIKGLDKSIKELVSKKTKPVRIKEKSLLDRVAMKKNEKQLSHKKLDRIIHCLRKTRFKK